MRNTQIVDQSDNYIEISFKASNAMKVISILFIVTLPIGGYFFIMFTELRDLIDNFFIGLLIPLTIFLMPIIILLIFAITLFLECFSSYNLVITDTHIYLIKKMMKYKVFSKRMLINEVVEWTGNGIENYTSVQFIDKEGKEIKLEGMNINNIELIISKLQEFKSRLE